ncbi:hypothetical protein JKF63_05456 [Porcisia hertigi]|uniref:Uncharacterized protein n=1 Tax=Porcisia hertigi TaxID=2761500 RepID=A0A836IBG4_9TRYP|nr:hypothetical protein JKF63_05456 [Porcisia hertigi]
MDPTTAEGPSPQLCDAVKAEPSTEGECAQQLHKLSRHQDVGPSPSVLDFVALWRRTAVTPSRHTAAPTNAKDAEEVKGAQSSSSSTLAVQTHAPNACIGTLSIGSVVFAPHRVRSGSSACVSGGTAGGSPITAAAAHQLTSPPPPPPPYRLHYALAEVTGIQSMAGTVAVSFLFTDPGIDDETVSMYECVPCPPACLLRWLREEGNPAASRCSLLERVLHVPPQEGPLPVKDIYQALQAAYPTLDSAPGASPLLAYQQRQRERCVARLHQLCCLSDDDGRGHMTTARNCSGVAHGASERDMAAMRVPLAPSTATADKAVLLGSSAGTATLAASAATISARYVAPTSVHVFFSGIFQQVNAYMEQRCSRHRRRSLADPTTAPLCRGQHPCRGGAAANAVPPPPRVLAIFDCYATLRRFHVFMTVRGHVVQLLDGTDACGAPPLPHTSHAFGAQCKVWLCMLRDDTGEDDAEEEARKDGFSVTGAGADDCNTGVAQAEALMEAQLRRLLAAAPPVDALVSFKEHVTQKQRQEVEEHYQPATLRQQRVTAEVVLQRLMPHLAMDPLVCVLQDVPAPPSTAPTAAAATVVKVSGAVFGANKILVPCSPEQLTLLSTVWASGPAPVSAITSNGGGAEGNSETAAQRQGPHTTKGARKRPRAAETTDSSAPTAAAGAQAQALTPSLLERISLGSFTDVAAATLLDVFADATAVVVKALDPSPADVPATVGDAHRSSGDGRGAAEVLSSIEDVYKKWCVDPSRFGEAFPVFAVVYALVADVFADVSRFRSGRSRSAGGWEAGICDNQPRQRCSNPPAADPSLERAVETRALDTAQMQSMVPLSASRLPRCRLGAHFGDIPRIALVLPRGNPTHHPNLGTQQYLRTLRAFFSPWAVHEAASVAASYAAPVLWHQRGGLLLLFCDEATTQLGALQDEADVVIACGKVAAAWVAANSATRTSHGDSCTGTAAAPVLFAVISEAEVVTPADQLTHLWLPITLSSSTSVREDHESAYASASGDRVEGCGWWPAMSNEETARTELEATWRRLVATVSADGSANVPARPSSPRRAGAAGRRLHQLEVLPRTVRQAVVLWRHLQTAEATMGAAQDQSCVPSSELDSEGPWRTLRAVVKEMALSSLTATPVRMTDVALVRSSDGEV